jgi:hypothetical protein
MGLISCPSLSNCAGAKIGEGESPLQVWSFLRITDSFGVESCPGLCKMGADFGVGRTPILQDLRTVIGVDISVRLLNEPEVGVGWAHFAKLILITSAVLRG